MSGFPYQKQVDEYYKVKIREVTRWMLDFVQDQKRITSNQRRELIWRADNISFSSAGDMNKYVQDLKTMNKDPHKGERLSNGPVFRHSLSIQQELMEGVDAAAVLYKNNRTAYNVCLIRKDFEENGKK